MSLTTNNHHLHCRTRPKPFLLMGHFFSVAAYGMYRLLWPIPTPARCWNAIKILYSACHLFLPLCVNEHLFNIFYPRFS